MSLSNLKHLATLLPEARRPAFFEAIAAHLSEAGSAAHLSAVLSKLGLETSDAAPSLILSAKILACRLASGAETSEILSELQNDAGVAASMAQSVLQCAEIAVLSRAEEIVQAQRHAAANAAVPYLVDFDWQLQYVLSSSTIVRQRQPLVVLDLISRQAAHEAETSNVLEHTDGDLTAMLDACDGASGALEAIAKRKAASPAT